MSEVIFQVEFDDRTAFEAECKGFIMARVRCDDGRTYDVEFITPFRLNQEFETQLEQGRRFDGRPGLILVQEVALDLMQEAAEQLEREGYFSRLTSIHDDA